MRVVRIVVVSSPGAASTPHWSHAAAAATAQVLAAAGHEVVWFAAARVRQALPSPPPGVELRGVPTLPPRALHQVARDNEDAGLESLLAHSLREQPAAAVVHFGAGGRGTPNVAWLAERMGSRALAVVRGAEVVCHRGDLVDRDGRACQRFDEAERCRRCCATSWWQTPSANDFLARGDLLAGSLLACESVFVADAADAATLVAFGLPSKAIVIGDAPAAIAAQVVAAVGAPAPRG